jgi:filamentous hemagglutinin
LGIPPEKVQAILDIPKPTKPGDLRRPDPSTYLTKDQISAHLAKFDDGAIRFTSRSSHAKYGTLGPEGGFVMPAKEFSDLVRATKGDLKLVEKKLGLDPGTLASGDTLIAYIEKKDLAGLRIPSGNEGGVHPSLWLPGGYTSGGVSEAVMDFAKGVPYKEIKL